MKTKFFVLQFAALLLSAAIAFSQPSKPPQINPENGLPGPASKEVMAWNPVLDTAPLAENVRSMTLQGRYEEALQKLLAYHNKYKTESAWIVLLPDWTELARRYPKAKTALFQIRNHDIAEFSEGRGFKDLFSEVEVVSHALHQDDATYDLFTSFRDTDPDLAQQCYGMVQEQLLAKGDYQWCFKHIGDPREYFEKIRQGYFFNLDCQKRQAAMREQIIKTTEQLERQHGRTNSTIRLPPDYSSKNKKSGEDNFVNETRDLIEILVAVNHKDDAKKIRDEAMTVLDDKRLKSAVSDAETKIKK